MRLPVANLIILSTGFAVAMALNVGLGFTPTNQRCGNTLNDACIRDLVVPFVLGLGFRDCTSFFRTTITVSPRTSTVTRTTTISTTVTENFEIRRRAVEAKPKRSIEIPTRIPSYAARCSGRARYSSACSCYGVRSAATITVHPPRTTAYVTVTKTATTTACFLCSLAGTWNMVAYEQGIYIDLWRDLNIQSKAFHRSHSIRFIGYLDPYGGDYMQQTGD
ncbi:hypothetical protein TWF225_004371 [Orbilia oligospora]|nr:hypothetical protein TWF225_004371 [Orbilia oligospora]KAF3260015.1 hypothetical protein TWF217_005040 [Orbilia oligospora]KAF3267097.1 hypothetical protein TWF128_010052 [Orbilia oligospora]